MGFGFRKSVNLGGGVRMNFSKKGVGLSAGTKGARVSAGPSGSRARVSVPGTGIYYNQKLGASKTSTRSSAYTEQQRQKQLEKEQQLELAQNEVQAFEDHLEYLTSMHKEATEDFDWHHIIATPPFADGEVGPNEQEAIGNLENYQPTFLEKLFRRTEARKNVLREEIKQAAEEDHQLRENWEKLKQLGEQVIAGDVNAYQTVLDDLAPFEDMKDLGSDFDYEFPHANTVEFRLYVHSEKVIPEKELSLTKTGKVSRKKMTKTNFYALYQDYVASCVLRIARELFALLPVEHVYIHAIGEIFDSSIGKDVEGTVLSARIDRETLNELNLDRIDCSDSLVNFEHNMKFRKTKGFAFVDPLVANE
ncbi:DUF4236 domain-containing protein [Virgibacillus xinjiangensis]|uniref:DUF4236 domain-containing protein n=1 Tax=Virgibacillus xinjiangensis TaxID=393090 RepID=A0ABV7CSC1_9BACI